MAACQRFVDRVRAEAATERYGLWIVELELVRSDHAAALLTFELKNRAYFAASIPDRGDDFFAHFEERHAGLLAWQAAGTDYFHVLIGDRGDVLGRVNLTRIADGCAELGFRIARTSAGRGLATTGVMQVCALASAEYGLTRLRARATNDNHASRAVLARTGFVETGAISLNDRPGTAYSRSLAGDT
jgi:ribosomal-protein-alanine N-acetyltransferase